MKKSTRDFVVTFCIQDKGRMMNLTVDGLWMNPAVSADGIVVVWSWGIKEGETEEEPVSYTQMLNVRPRMQEAAPQHYVILGPSFLPSDFEGIELPDLWVPIPDELK